MSTEVFTGKERVLGGAHMGTIDDIAQYFLTNYSSAIGSSGSGSGSGTSSSSVIDGGNAGTVQTNSIDGGTA